MNNVQKQYMLFILGAYSQQIFEDLYLWIIKNPEKVFAFIITIVLAYVLMCDK